VSDKIRETVTSEVMLKLREILCNANAVISENDDFISDLKIISDDLSCTFIPDLEDKFGVRGSQEQWYKVHLVRDSIELLTMLYKSK